MKFMAKHGLLPLSLLLLALMLRFACAVDSSMNIACGRSGNFTDSQGNIWFGDGDFANLGLAGSVSNYSSVAMPLNTLRYFPGHQLVCYSFSLVPQGTKITVTTKFYYGNYDQNKYSPIFYVKYDSNEWTRIVTNSSAVVAYTQAYTTQYEDVNVCLGTPKDDNINTLFINTLQVSGPGINTRQSKPAMGKFNTDPPLQETKKKPNMAVVVVPIVVIFVLVVIGVVVIFLISRPSRKTQDNNRSAPTGQGPPAPKPANMQGNASPKYSQAPFAEDPSAPGTSNMQRNAASKNSQGNAVAKRLIEINRSFTFAEINKITNNFKTRIGKGGSAVVYYGQLTDGHEVAVKVLSDKGAKVFVSEVQLLLTVHHKSIAAFVGYCEEGENLILMYEYMRGGDLRKLLSGEAKNSELLTWEKRLQIAQTVATGLDYLHSCCRPQIIHRDVKTNNILLNENLEARLADFGLCKESPDDNVAYMSTIVVGTPGYVDPEYYQTNRLTKKSDVYSFGVVLLELISGLSPVFTATDGSHGILVQWARQHLQTNDLESVADPYLGGQYSTESMWKVACTAWACTHQASIERPTMADVVSQLREAMAVQIHHGATHVPCTTPASTPSAWASNGKVSASTQRIIEINRAFTYSEIRKITNNFQTRIGKGASGVVYKGQLTDGDEVAVKVLNDKGAKVFVSEVRLLLTVHHKSLAGFVGYCEEGSNLILMYEYMRGGDLRKLLSGERSKSKLLTWEKRLEIAQTVATGLDYLHSCCRPQIIHRDVKTNNILLNENLEARLADFGLCKESPDDNVAYMSTIVVGTPGYVDPEYFSTNRLTKKSDVYSFGVVLLELISGLSPIFPASDGRRLVLVQWATQHLQTTDLESVADPNLGGQYSVESMRKVAYTALACTAQASIERPTMADVVSQLREAMDVQTHMAATDVRCTTPASTPSAWASTGAAFKEIAPPSASSTDYSSSSY